MTPRPAPDPREPTDFQIAMHALALISWSCTTLAEARECAGAARARIHERAMAEWMKPDRRREGIFQTHNCARCRDGADLSRCPTTPERPGNSGEPIARND